MEGVMMRGRQKLAVAVRQPDGQIAVQERPNWRLSQYAPIMQVPFLRGVAAFIEALVVGIDAILFSANASQSDDVQMGKGEAFFAVFAGLALGVGLFILLPTFIVHLVQPVGWAPFGSICWRVCCAWLFLLYILLIGLMPDMHRFYQYHGAEHKAIYTFEAGEELTVANLRPKSCHHPRCGTAFMLW